MIRGLRQRLSRLELSVPIPPKSDKSISVSLSPISESASMRRAANGDLISIARPVFRRYRISIQGDDVIPPGIQSLFPGDYIECVVPDFMLFNGSSVDRVSLDAHEVLSNGQKADPALFMTDEEYDRSSSIGGLVAAHSPARVSYLRSPGATAIPGAYAIRCRPIFACRVMSWQTSAPEALAKTSWSLELEEV